MPEENIQPQQRERVRRLDIRPRDVGPDINAPAANDPFFEQPTQEPGAGIAQKRRDLQRSKSRARSRLRTKKPPKKLVGVGFWMIVGVVIFKELMDPFIMMLQFFTDISTVAGVGAGVYTGSAKAGVAAGVIAKAVSYIPYVGSVVEAAVEIPFKLLWWAIGTVATFTASFIIWYYLAIANGISFGMRKLAMFMVVFLVEAVPVLNLVPSTVLALFIIRRMENSDKKDRFREVAKNRYR